MSERFYGPVHWRQLSAEAMEEIGAAALELVACWHAQRRVEEDGFAIGEDIAGRLQRGADAAEPILFQVLRSAVNDHVGEEKFEADGLPLLPSMLGPTCRTCGCSELDACQPLSCSWVEPDLCSACAPAGAP